MNLFRATIDTRHPNSVVANINQFDDATLELQILSDGQVSEPWSNPRFRIIAIKKDGNEVEQSDNIELIDADNHIIQIKLKEQMVTCRGMVKMQLIINESERTSTSIFYLSIAQSIENQVIESHRDVKTLDDLEAYIAQGREVIANAEEIVTNLKNEMSEFNQEAKTSESERQANELNRASKELIRIDNEEERVANETERVANEEIRIENEEDRVANEQDRVANETNRRIAENTRIAQERARQEAELQRNTIFEENENLRKENEKGRIANENDRKKKFSAWEDRETVRLKSEENRILQEQDRVESEEQREQNEAARQQQESHRQQTYNQFNDSESTRQANELERQKAEQQRAQAELARNETFNQSQDDRNRQYAEAEEIRKTAFEQNEANRQEEYTQAERERVESEELRKAREREREDAESQRQSAESNRDAAESQRIENFNTAISDANNTMNEAVANINQAIADSNTTMTAIENRADACLPIIEQSSIEITQARTDYTGTTHDSLRQANDANVEYVLGEVNTMHYEGQTITAHDSLAGRAKNAIIEGVTLVNLVPTKIIDYTASSDWDGYHQLVQNSKQSFDQWRALQDLKPNTKYYISCYVETFEVVNNEGYCLNNPSMESIFGDSMIVNGVGRYQWLSTTKSELTDEIFMALRCQNAHARGAIKIRDIMIIEYQEGMENWDIPYFEGMTSVKAPVLKSVGKNLSPVNEFNLPCKTGVSTNGYPGAIIANSIKAKPNTEYTFSYDLISGVPTGTRLKIITLKDLAEGPNTHVDLYTHDNRIKEYTVGSGQTFTTDENAKYLAITTGNFVTTGNEIIINDIQIEEGTAATEFEQYISNSITTANDLILRGINDVKDTLDIAASEKVERIAEIVLDGSENWGVWQSASSADKTVIGFGLLLDDAPSTRNFEVISDKFATGGIISNGVSCNHTFYVTDKELVGGYYANSNINQRLGLSILKTRIGMSSDETATSQAVQKLKEYLSQEPITLCYELAEPITTKVDLSSNVVYSYKDTTHYSFEVPDGSLIPTLSIDVPTNLPVVVSRQSTMINQLENENKSLKNENKALKTEIKETSTSSINGDLELMSQQFDLDFRIFEIETTLDIPTTLNIKGAKSMAMTVFQQAQTLILAGKYDREDMEYKLRRYKEGKRITQDEYDELMAMMDAQELVK